MTLAGKPLPDVMVQFLPESGGRPGTGITDTNGHYTLSFVDGAEGAPVGPCRVEITTVWPDGEPPPGKRDPIQTKYNAESTLKVTVESGSNEFNFDLEPGGAKPRK